MPASRFHSTVLLCVAAAASLHAAAYDGEDMAPGLARVLALDPGGEMRVAVLDTAFSGRWRDARAARDSALLREHWRGGPNALARARLAVAELRNAHGSTLRCEFVNDAQPPAGVCLEGGTRLYYLAPARAPQ
jgi:hypothetical protein